MSKHTPGPWEVCQRDRLAGVRHVDADGGVYDVCRCDWYSHKRPDKRAEANARLIAAAPDLLAALKALRKDVATYYGDGACWPKYFDGAMRDALLAIEYAEGDA